MKVKVILLHVCFIYAFISAISGQRFPCDGQLLLAMNEGANTTIAKQIPIPFSPPFLSPVARYFNASFDALGFCSKDNFIYGVAINSNKIVRLKANNSYEVIGTLPLMDTLFSNAGDCTLDGLYVCHDYKLNQLLIFDVTNSFQLLKRIDLFWDPSSKNIGPFKNRIFDIAIDPNDSNFAYTYQGQSALSGPTPTSGFILKININTSDPNLGMVTAVKKVDDNIGHIGGLAFSPESFLAAYGTSNIGVNPFQNTMYGVNIFTGESSQILIGYPKVEFSDGCSCPFSFTFTNIVPTEGMYCNNDEKVFRLKIDNKSFNAIDGISLVDTFPEGMVVKAVDHSRLGNIANISTGIGTNILKINGLDIPPKSSIEINVTVLSVDAKVGIITNQAFLENLPERYNGNLPSDDLGTVGVENDAAAFSVIPRELEGITWKVNKPTDCLKANDGKVVIASKQFFSGQKFEIGLRNKIGWGEKIFNVEIDNNNSITLDSLIPGDYQVFNFRLLSKNCGLALKDTTIIIEAPTNQLQLNPKSNSPVCEGELLNFEGQLSPQCYIWWTGPSGFSIEKENPIRTNVDTSYSGEYKVLAIYGYCQLTKYLDVEVKPKINASISGDSVYCERDNLLLKANGKGKNLTYNWNGPNGIIGSELALVKNNMGINDGGDFIVVASNGACTDTAITYVDVLPTPSVSLEDKIISDFCTTITLSPELFGDTKVSYRWSPQDGLSCDDCLNPKLQPLVQTKYELKVENDYLCADSATINIILNKDKLVFTPNILRPSSSSSNNSFLIQKGCVTNFILSLDIYDRWGNNVFHRLSNSADDAITSWDGFYKGRQCGSGVYVWFAKVELVDGAIEYLRGDVTVVK